VLSSLLVVGCGKEWTSYLDVIGDRGKWEECQIEVGNWKGWICCCYERAVPFQWHQFCSV